MTIAIDFDGCIHLFSRGWQDGKIYDVIIDDALKEINYLMQKGHKIIILTARTDFDAVRVWMSKQGFDMSKIEVTNVKPPANAYIDDRAIRFTNWNDMVKYF